MDNSSPLRERLADLLRQRSDIEARVAEQYSHANRLDTIHDAVAPARAALDEFDREHADAMSRFAKGEGGQPKTDGARRQGLVSAIVDAEVASAAARVAQEQFRSNALAEQAPLGPLQREIDETERLIVLEDATALLPEMKAAIASVFSLKKQLDSARFAAIAGVDLSQFRELGAALSKFDDARFIAEARPLGEPTAQEYFLSRDATEMLAQSAAVWSFPTVSSMR